MEDMGLTHLYCGDGKGKTTSAMGLGLRALGRGKRVLLVQFLKGSGSGERAALLKLPGFDALTGPDRIKFSVAMNPAERKEARNLCETLLREAETRCAEGAYDLLILDEVCAAVSGGFLDEQKAAAFIDHKPRPLELVLTGRNPPPSLVERADYITEMKNVRHPYARGISAREGIEY